jgi:hypothetical protein
MYDEHIISIENKNAKRYLLIAEKEMPSALEIRSKIFLALSTELAFP